MELSCRTPQKKLSGFIRTSSSSKKKSRIKSLIQLENMSTPDRFLPCRSPLAGYEFSYHEISKSVRKDSRKQISPKDSENDFVRRTLFESQNFTPTRRMLNFNTPSPGNERVYWNKYPPHKNFTQKERPRKIPTAADAILDAPNVIDDFYLNLLDWGHTDQLAVGLGCSAYLFNPRSLKTHELLQTSRGVFPSSLRWNSEGNLLAVGLSNTELQIWDPTAHKHTYCVKSHNSRVGCISWHPRQDSILCTGSQSGEIHIYDIRVRVAHPMVQVNTAHSLDVCGLQWSPSGRYLASGGNDNVVNIWNTSGFGSPHMTFKEHSAAVKALSWCPWQSSLLASGGGTADKTIHLWNISTGVISKTVETKSQVSGVLWSVEHRELLTSHGYEENSLMIWNPETLQNPSAILKGHNSRILHLTMSPSGQEVATLAADETMRIWKCFTFSKRSLDFSETTTDEMSSFEKDMLFYML